MDAIAPLAHAASEGLPIARAQRPQRRRILPGFPLTLGYTLFYLSAIVLIPLSTLVIKCVKPTAEYPSVGEVTQHVYRVVTDGEAVASYEVSFGLSFAAALVNVVFGFIGAWVLVRYTFPGRRMIDALVDLPFAMPTSVAGLALTYVFSTNNGNIGEALFHAFGWKIAYTRWGILVALTFIGFPFVVRTLQPVLAALSAEMEEAAACLGANRWQTFARVILPVLWPALITGGMLAFGRAVGEYGSVIFISSMIPFQTEITPQMIVVKLEEYDYVGAAALGLAMLLMSFLLVGLANYAQHVLARRRGEA